MTKTQIDWRTLVAWVRRHVHELIPECSACDVGVYETGGRLEFITTTTDGGVNEFRWNLIEQAGSDGDRFYSFKRHGSSTIMTIPKFRNCKGCVPTMEWYHKHNELCEKCFGYPKR